MDAAALRAWRWERQGLPRRMKGASPAEVLARSGWARSVGGANPYLTLWARAGTSRAEAEAAMRARQIHELPAVRGCTYAVPREDFGLALRLGQGAGEDPEVAMAKRFLGVTDAEIEALSDRVLRALDDGGTKDPAALKAELGDTVRNLGEEGRKRGLTTTLPLALGRLQSRGEILRQPVDGRFDRQRYAYVRWGDALPGLGLSFEDASVALARRYFSWMGVATAAEFRAFSGLGVRAGGIALTPLGLVPLEEGSDLLVLPEERDAALSYRTPGEPEIALVSGMDSLLLHRREIRSLLNKTDLGRTAAGGGPKPLGGLQELPNHAILDRGRIIGLWEYDPGEGEIAWTTFDPPTDAIRAAISETEAFIRDELGDCRSFSLDSPASRAKTIAALRAMG